MRTAENPFFLCRYSASILSYPWSLARKSYPPRLFSGQHPPPPIIVTHGDLSVLSSLPVHMTKPWHQCVLVSMVTRVALPPPMRRIQLGVRQPSSLGGIELLLDGKILQDSRCGTPFGTDEGHHGATEPLDTKATRPVVRCLFAGPLAGPGSTLAGLVPHHCTSAASEGTYHDGSSAIYGLGTGC